MDAKIVARQMQAYLSRDTEAAQKMIQAMPDVIELPTTPLLQTHLLPPELDSVAVLVLDVNDGDRTRGLQTLQKFEKLGIGRRRALFDGTPLPLGPKGWSYFLWRWQVVITAAPRPPLHTPRKLLFAELLCPNDWYEQLAHGQTGSMGLFIGNFFEENVSLQAILDHMSAGELLACILVGVTADGKVR
ncbi:hypothetical protein BKG69_15970 [Mycobacteroides chelonae]|uniref:hypothetical protein n=1 Tax=Mycobacteroides chelonae TaxID=1774 RepID=UPI0008A92B3E|nr:hypothetical protein [Mycobacteroides chelonae]OHT78142.1 hypothetical protein BKG69_15970 [Mycobacteroides chelonae]